MFALINLFLFDFAMSEPVKMDQSQDTTFSNSFFFREFRAHAANFLLVLFGFFAFEPFDFD